MFFYKKNSFFFVLFYFLQVFFLYNKIEKEIYCVGKTFWLYNTFICLFNFVLLGKLLGIYWLFKFDNLINEVLKLICVMKMKIWWVILCSSEKQRFPKICTFYEVCFSQCTLYSYLTFFYYVHEFHDLILLIIPSYCSLRQCKQHQNPIIQSQNDIEF